VKEREGGKLCIKTKSDFIYNCENEKNKSPSQNSTIPAEFWSFSLKIALAIQVIPSQSSQAPLVSPTLIDKPDTKKFGLFSASAPSAAKPNENIHPSPLLPFKSL
jgi:hypothetical protein